MKAITMKTTVKYKLFKLMKGQGTIIRKDLCLLIFKAQGKKGEEAKTYRPGYYGNNLQDWVREGYLVQPEGGGYKLSKLGEDFLVNPEIIHYKVQAKKYKNLAERNYLSRRSLSYEVMELKSRLRDIRNKADI